MLEIKSPYDSDPIQCYCKRIIVNPRLHKIWEVYQHRTEYTPPPIKENQTKLLSLTEAQESESIPPLIIISNMRKHLLRKIISAQTEKI